MFTAVFFDFLACSDASPRVLSSFPSGRQCSESGSPAKILRCQCNKWLLKNICTLAQHHIVLVLISGFEKLLIFQDDARARCDRCYFHFKIIIVQVFL